MILSHISFSISYLNFHSIHPSILHFILHFIIHSMLILSEYILKYFNPNKSGE